MFKQIKNKVKNKFLLLKNQEDILGKLSLASLQFKTYLPHSKSSLSFSSIKYVLNDVVINNRKKVIEFGGGISTLYLAKLAQTSKSNLTITTIDHDKDWIEMLEKILIKEDLLSFVNLIHAPLNDCKISLNNNEWYDTATITKNISDLKFDMVLVDGPLAYKKGFQTSRYPALPFIFKYLNDNNSVFLDDTNRKGEKKIITLWESKFDRNFISLNTESMISFKGNYFNIH